MLIEDFKNIVDSYSSTILSDNLEQACKQLGIDTTNGYGRNQVTEKLYQNIREALQLKSVDKTNGISKTELLKLKSTLIYRHVLYDEDPVVYLNTLEVIKDSCRQDGDYFLPFSDTVQWEKAIINCKNYNTFSPSTFSANFEEIRKNYPKDFDRAISAKQLVEKGCEIEITDSDIVVKSGIEVLVKKINEKIKEIGGITMAKYLFSHLNNHQKYSERFERYFITRETSGVSFNQRPQIPFGMLLNLSLKYPYENSKVKNPKKLLIDIIDLSIIISNGTYGVQHYSFWEFHFQTSETLVQFYTQIALWDSIFSIPQCRYSTALNICDYLFSIIDENEFKNTLGFTRQEFITVCDEIQNNVTNVHFPTIIYQSKLFKELKFIENVTILRILDFLSHSKVNEDYILPSDYLSINFGLKPLLKLGPTKFLLMNKAWCAPNYFESLATAFREKTNIDNKLGDQLELYLQNNLKTKGISFSTGDYRVDGVDGECDFLIESKRAIVLIEFKKKVLTRKSKSGDDNNIFIDLSKSVLFAQIQAGRTEIILKEKGSITLKTKDGSTNTIDLNNRLIERVALTQLEFGGLHDKTIFNHFLTTILTHTIKTNSEEEQVVKDYNKLEKKREMWVAQYNKLCELDDEYPSHAFWNCSFMSLYQLLEVINISTNNDSFYEILTKTKHISLGTLNWYREFDMATHIQNQTK